VEKKEEKESGPRTTHPRYAIARSSFSVVAIFERDTERKAIPE